MLSDRRRDDGFTLIELVVSIAILGIVVVAMSAAFTVAFASNRETEERLDGSQPLQFASTWFASDVASANDVKVNTAASCGTGTALVLISNRDIVTPPTAAPTGTPPVTLTIEYVLQSPVNGERTLLRRACGRYSASDVVARYLSETIAPVAACTPACSSFEAATLQLATVDDLTFTLKGSRRIT